MAQANFKIEQLMPHVPNWGTSLAVDFTGSSSVALPAGTTINGASLTALGTITSSSANALAVGLNGATNPAFNVDASTGSQAAGLNVIGATAAGTVAVAVISSGASANLTIDAKGSGTIGIAGTSTGAVTITPATTITGNLTVGSSKLVVTAASGNSSSTGTFTAVNAGALTSGGNTTAAYLLSATANFGIYFGADAPTISAAKGSLYLCSNGSSTSTRLYVNNGTTTWIAVTTAS